jgi:hypothetical protein
MDKKQHDLELLAFERFWEEVKVSVIHKTIVDAAGHEIVGVLVFEMQFKPSK